MLKTLILITVAAVLDSNAASTATPPRTRRSSVSEHTASPLRGGAGASASPRADSLIPDDVLAALGAPTTKVLSPSISAAPASTPPRSAKVVHYHTPERPDSHTNNLQATPGGRGIVHSTTKTRALAQWPFRFAPELFSGDPVSNFINNDTIIFDLHARVNDRSPVNIIRFITEDRAERAKRGEVAPNHIAQNNVCDHLCSNESLKTAFLYPSVLPSFGLDIRKDGTFTFCVRVTAPIDRQLIESDGSVVMPTTGAIARSFRDGKVFTIAMSGDVAKDFRPTIYHAAFQKALKQDPMHITTGKIRVSLTAETVGNYITLHVDDEIIDELKAHLLVLQAQTEDPDKSARASAHLAHLAAAGL